MADLKIEDMFPTFECKLIAADKTHKNGQEMLLLTVEHEGKRLKYGVLGSRVKDVLSKGRKEADGTIFLHLEAPKGDSITWIV